MGRETGTTSRRGPEGTDICLLQNVEGSRGQKVHIKRDAAAYFEKERATNFIHIMTQLQCVLQLSLIHVFSL